jgi:D-alanyl-D-alanine endopeptidase (penicillin-binding protein 7)
VAHSSTDNAVAIYELPAKIQEPKLKIKPTFWIGVLATALFLHAGSASAEPTAKKKTTAAKKPATKLYSAERSLTRQAKLARARAALMAHEMAVTPLPRYKVDASGDLVPDVRAAAAIIYNPETNQVLWEENSQAQRSIASITKMMTAVVFMEINPDLSQPVTVARSDVFQASTTRLRANDHVTADDLMHLLLIASDNAAARALARISPFGAEGFVGRMNEKAEELGLHSTHYADPSGLLSDNVSSAYDMARLIAHVSSDDRIASIMRTPEYTFYTGSNRLVAFHSTNHLLGRSDVDVLAGKTGFISAAGYCLATLLRMPSSNQQVAVVVLGARSNASRFMETENLFTWLSSKATTLFGTAKPATPEQP